MIFRLFEAQPFIRRLWDPKNLYSLQGLSNEGKVPLKLVHEYTMRMLYDETDSQAQPDSERDQPERLGHNLALDSSLRVNKRLQGHETAKHDAHFGLLSGEAIL